MRDAFSTNTGGLGAATQMSRSLENTKARGTFYIAFEFSDELSIDPWNDGGDRTMIELTSLMHKDCRTTFYYKDNKTSEWHPLHYFHPDLAGYALNLVLWASANVDEAEGVQNVMIDSHSSALPAFDLFGRPINVVQPGVTIQNGRKILR